jgi:hypothetical protein
MPPDIVSINKSPNGATVATINRGNRGGGGSINPNDFIKKTEFRRYNFSTPAMFHRVEHNMNTTQFQETVRDDLGNRIYSQIEIEDDNTFVVHFTEAMPCTIDVLYGIEYTP